MRILRMRLVKYSFLQGHVRVSSTRSTNRASTTRCSRRSAAVISRGWSVSRPAERRRTGNRAAARGRHPRGRLHDRPPDRDGHLSAALGTDRTLPRPPYLTGGVVRTGRGTRARELDVLRVSYPEYNYRNDRLAAGLGGDDHRRDGGRSLDGPGHLRKRRGGP